jgi:hypothetical protein
MDWGPSRDTYSAGFGPSPVFKAQGFAARDCRAETSRVRSREFVELLHAYTSGPFGHQGSLGVPW